VPFSLVRYSDAKVGGSIIFVATVQFALGMIIAESFYPGYSVSGNYISDLGATCRQMGPNENGCIIHQPTATIFNSSAILLGVLVLAGGYFLQRAFRRRVFTILIVLTGVGITGVGIFPETAGAIHSIASLFAFLFGGLGAIVAYKVERAPLTYLSIVLGAITLVALALYVSNIYLGLGAGGMERMVVYPELLWGIGFAAHLMNTPQ
jgi:hypothetical membrane protein